MDRGAMSTEMDAELMSLLQPNTAQKMTYASTPAPDEDEYIPVRSQLSTTEGRARSAFQDCYSVGV